MPRPGAMHLSKRKNRMGRPLLLTLAIQDAICKWLRHGNFISDAYALADVPPPTGREWYARGRKAWREGRQLAKSERVYADFSAAADKAMAEADAADLAIIELAARKDWKAAAWRLRARTPSRYGPNGIGVRVEQTDETHPDGTIETSTRIVITGNTPDELTDLTDEDYAAAAEVLVTRKRARMAESRGRVIDVSALPAPEPNESEER